jgi:hypothetical protein
MTNPSANMAQLHINKRVKDYPQNITRRPAKLLLAYSRNPMTGSCTT